MFKIETDELGVIEAETEAEAMKLLRTAKRKFAAQRRKTEKARCRARKIAQASVFGYLNSMVAGKDASCHWGVGEPNSPLGVRVRVEDCWHIAKIRAGEESAELRLYDQPIASLCSMAGEDRIIFTWDGREVLALAVGVCDGEVGTVVMEGVRLDYFPNGKEILEKYTPSSDAKAA